MVSRPITDKESNKFDSEDRVKVSIEADNTTSTERNVKVTNDSSESIPVTITNTDTSVDLEVNIAENVTIDTTTPLDVNVTNTSVDTNATIQGTPNVSVTNDVSIDDATAIRVDVTNASLATNATIQNSNLDVTVQNAFQYVYDMVYDGLQWRFQLSDSSGKAINLDHTYYTATEITAMGSSTDINLWLSAYNDSMLAKKYVSSYEDEHEEIVHYQHPSIISGKCLKLIHQYSTENSVKVVKSIFASVDDWTFEDSIKGTVAITNGTISNPDPNGAISQGVDVCTLSITNNTVGPITIELSGTAASFYQLNDGTTVGNTLTYDATKSYLLECASNFSGFTYSHSVTITVTGTDFNVSDSVNIATFGTYIDSSYQNLYANKLANNGFFSASQNTLYTWGTQDFHQSPSTAVQNRTIKHAFEGMGYLRTGGNQDYNGYPYSNQSYSWSIWVMIPNISQANNFQNAIMRAKNSAASIDNSLNLWVLNSSGAIRLYGNVGKNSSGNISVGSSSATLSHAAVSGEWFNITCVRDASSNNHKIYVNGVEEYSDTFNSSSTDSSNIEIDNLYNYSSTYANSSYHGAHLVKQVYGNTDLHLAVDELSTWNVALPATGTTSVSSIYNSGKPTDLSGEAGLIGYWRFGDGNDGSGTADSTSIIYDMSSSGNHMSSSDATKHPTSLSLSVLDSIYTGPVFANLEGIAGPNHHVSTGSATSGAYMETGRGLISNQTYFEDLSANPKTVSFWLKAPQLATNKEVNLFGEASGWRMRGAHIQKTGSTGYYTVYLNNMNTGTTYSQGGATTNIPIDTWVFVSLVYDTNVATSKCYIQTSSTFNNTAILFGTGYVSANNAFVNGSSLAIDTAYFLGARAYNNNIYPTSSTASQYDATSIVEIDEFTVFDKELTVTEIEELHNSHETLDATTHSAASNLFRYIRFGDGTDDTESIIKCAVDPTFVLDKDSGASNTYQESLTSLDDPYIP